MMKLIKMNSDEDIKQIIRQSKQVALIALQRYDLNWERIRFNQLSETCTFIIETSEDGDFLLRIHSGMTKEEIDSEIIWLDFLNEKLRINLPKGILARDGSKTIKIDQENGIPCYASLMRWVEGAHASGGLKENQIYQEGILLAKLHQASQNFELTPNFVRPIWGEQSFRKAMTRLTQHYAHFLTKVEFELYQLVAERILIWINKINKNDETYGLVHGDLHQGNIIFHDGNPHPIDFGRCGFGYFLYDIAHTILGLYPSQREFVIKGYESIRKLETDWFPVLESFTVMVMIENYCHHATDPRETEQLKEEQPYAQAIMRSYLTGTPFLFNSIEV